MNAKNMLLKKEQLDEVFQENNCLIYGAGRVAKTVVNYASKKQFVINKILVSNMLGNPLDIMGISVYAIMGNQENLSDKCLIVCAMEKLHSEIEKEMESLDSHKIVYISDELYGQLTYANGNYELDNIYEFRRLVYELEKKVEKKIVDQKESLLRFVPRPCMEYMVLNILDHCNLRCKGCDHFACIADPYFVPYETIHRDLDRLSEIFHGDYFMKMSVMGGEPLLHPDLLKILEDVRAHFPYVTIRLTTNGLLLLKQSQDFWRVCRENKVTIINTRYPINLDFNEMREKAKSEGVEFNHFEGTGDEAVKTLFKKTINLKGDSDPVESFANCHISNYGNFLMEGKLYSCPFSCQSYRIFNQKFEQNLRLTENDYLDIYKVNNMQEVLSFAAKPKYYCRYCSGLSPKFEWGRSKHEMCEWVETEE